VCCQPPSSFLVPALVPRRLSHNAASSLRSTQRHPALLVVCVYLLSGAFAHSGSSLARPDPINPPSHAQKRWQDVLNKPTSTQHPQVRDSACPPRALLPIEFCVYACVCCHLHTFMPAFTVEPTCARRPFVLKRFARLLGSPSLAHVHTPILSVPPPRHCAPCYCVLCVVRHHRVFLPLPAHTFGAG